MPKLRVLALDHYFDQDLRSLEAHPRLDVRRMPYQRLRNPALRILGKEVGTGLTAFNNPELKAARVRYSAWLQDEVRRLYLEAAFDIIVLPSDTFFYVRDLPAAAHAIGVPVVVVQKETTISVDTMDNHSVTVGSEAPFVADFMMVCSERHKEFWVRAGADADHVKVTGQPRFDAYTRPQARRASSQQRVLFLSYELDAYVPGVGQGMGLHTWEPLRRETESVLLDSARSGALAVVVKCHPQQNHRAETRRLRELAGSCWRHGFDVADADADTRDLILAADVVIGFQTTAIYEAVAAEKPVIYAAWGSPFEEMRDQLIPFHLAPQTCVRHATGPEELAMALKAESARERGSCTPWYEEALGPVDGHATDRVASRLVEIARAFPPALLRRELESHRRRFAMGLLIRATAAHLVWTAATPVARIAGEQTRVATRRRHARERRGLAIRGLRG